jgi:hypothetical protein
MYRPLFNDEDLVVGVMCVIEDVTALKGAQKALQKAKDELMAEKNGD